jgi:hypothetical protein
MTFRSVSLRRLMGTLPCARCGASDGTVCGAHYFGPMRHRLGGGIGHKVTDAAMAALCHRCHLLFDSYAGGNTVDRSEEFLFLIVRSYDLLWERGHLNVRWAPSSAPADPAAG